MSDEETEILLPEAALLRAVGVSETRVRQYSTKVLVFRDDLAYVEFDSIAVVHGKDKVSELQTFIDAYEAQLREQGLELKQALSDDD